MLQTNHDARGQDIELIDTAEIPGGGQLQLFQRGADFSILFELDELMGSQVRHSEEALATLACARLTNPESRLLIGGLGMGFTLGAALAASPSGATIVVAEFVPKVLSWARGPLAHLFGDHLMDPRVTLEVADVHDLIDRATAHFDAILLDVDNGPDALIRLANDRLYCNWGLRAAYSALRPGGVLAIWSAYPDPAFADRLKNAGFTVEEIGVEAAAGEGDVMHTIWMASRSA